LLTEAALARGWELDRIEELPIPTWACSDMGCWDIKSQRAKDGALPGCLLAETTRRFPASRVDRDGGRDEGEVRAALYNGA